MLNKERMKQSETRVSPRDKAMHRSLAFRHGSMVRLQEQLTQRSPLTAQKETNV
jgi:hypothetical protein